MSHSKLTIRDVPLDNHTVLVRSDFDSPLNSLGIINDDSLIKASLPTINHLLNRGCKVVIISHVNGLDGLSYGPSLEAEAQRLASLLRRDVRFADVTIGDKVYQIIKRAPKNSVIVLENLNFHLGERLNDQNFAEKLAKSTKAKYFVQDSPGILHNTHASTDMITMFIPSVAGFLLQAEQITDDLPGIRGLLDSRAKLE